MNKLSISNFEGPLSNVFFTTTPLLTIPPPPSHLPRQLISTSLSAITRVPLKMCLICRHTSYLCDDFQQTCILSSGATNS